MEENQYCVLWNNYHNSLVQTLEGLFNNQQLVNVTIVCADGNKISAHQLVLAACSTFFKNFIKDNPTNHPLVLLPADIQFPELKSMIKFMYTGQVCVQSDRLQMFIRAARYLRIRGLEDSGDSEDIEEVRVSENPSEYHQTKYNLGNTSREEEIIVKKSEIICNKIKDHKYTEKTNLADSEDNNENWEVVDIKPIIFPLSNTASSGKRKRKKRYSSVRKRQMQLSNNVICYEKKNHSDADYEKEPINKIRRLNSPGHLHDEDLDICTCTSKKIWSVRDTETLLKTWKETLTQVPPSYFIRSMALCRSVARRLQLRGIQKNWRQCQVKMKNLRREVRLYKESDKKINPRKPSEVATACEKLMPFIEEIFNMEEEIRQRWYLMKEDRSQEDRVDENGDNIQDILAQVAVLAESDMCDDDTDTQQIETENEAGACMTEGEVETLTENDDSFVNNLEVPHHRMHTDSQGTVHHIVEDVSLHLAKQNVTNR